MITVGKQYQIILYILTITRNRQEMIMQKTRTEDIHVVKKYNKNLNCLTK